jgi:hypothetical protein
MMCTLLIQQQQQDHQQILILTIAKLLTNPQLYKHLYRDATTPAPDADTSEADMEGMGILRIQQPEMMFSFTRYILQPVLMTYTNKT